MPLNGPIDELQAHSAPITVMRLNHYNDWLFTACKDGFIYIYEVKEKDPRTGLQIIHNPLYSDELLTEKQEIDETIQHKEALMNELANARDPSHTGVNEKASASESEDKIKKLHEQLSSQSLMIRSKIEQLDASKNEIQDQFEKQLQV